MFKFQKNVFSKLYRYYCTKLLTKIWTVLFYFALFALYFFFIFINKKVAQSYFGDANTWQRKLTIFWIISLVQLFALYLTMTPLVSYLVGRGLGWEELKKKQLFSIPKISRKEDVEVLLFTPGVDRETVILAKFAAAFTWFMGINFLLVVLPLFIYLLTATELGIMAAFLFLILNGIGFALVNFLLLVPLLFYQQEISSILFALIMVISIVTLVFAVYLLQETIQQYPLIFISLSIPFSILIGYSFFTLYRKKFLESDLE